MPPCFHERPTLVLAFTNGKKSEEDFRFYEKRQKVKICSAFVLQQAIMEALVHPLAPQAVGVAPPSSFPRNYTQHLNIKPS